MLIKPTLSFLLILLTTLEGFSGPNTRVVIDPGHGGKDEGAVWYGVRESDLNLKVAKKVEALLIAKNIPVTMTRRSDVFVTLTKRAAVANKYTDVIFVSIHFNAHRLTSVRGVETFYASDKGKPIAISIQRKLVSLLKTRNRYIKRGINYAVLNKTKCPAVLVECGFISNPTERSKCNSSGYQTLAAKGIVSGILQAR